MMRWTFRAWAGKDIVLGFLPERIQARILARRAVNPRRTLWEWITRKPKPKPLLPVGGVIEMPGRAYQIKDRRGRIQIYTGHIKRVFGY